MIFTCEQISKLNETETGVYHYVIKNIDKIDKMSIRELARESHVSTATINRFCHKLECEGYAEFKLKLKLFNEKLSLPEIDKESEMLYNFFKNSEKREFKRKIDDAVNIILDNDNVIFLGVGQSGVLGKYGARFFSNIGIYSQCVDDPFYPAPIKKNEGCTIIVISSSGETTETINQLKYYQSTNAKVIAITNQDNSTIAKMSEISLCYYIQNIVLSQTYNITSQVPVIYIIEKLARKLQASYNLKKCNNSCKM